MQKFKNHADRRAAIMPIVRTMRSVGNTVSEIAKRTGVSRKTIASWIGRRDFGIPAICGSTAEDELRAAIARLDSIYLEAMAAWEESKSGKTVETCVAVDENNFVREQKASRRVTTSSHGDVGYLYAAIRAVEAAGRVRVILDGRPPATGLDRLLVLSEEAFVRRVREMSDQEIRSLEGTIKAAAPKTFALEIGVEEQ